MCAAYAFSNSNTITVKRLNLFPLFALILGFIGCGSSSDDEPVVTESIACLPTQINAGYEKYVATIDITASREWSVYSEESWITYSQTGSLSTKGTVEVTVAANTETKERQGTLVLKAGSSRTTVTVKQAAKPETPVDPTITAPEGYKLVWHDEFNEGVSPNLDRWSYEVGGGGWGNNELQTYVAGSQGGEQLAVLKDGIFSIVCKKVSGKVCSIRINTKESWKYGYFEARLKLPAGKGTWPAFWMMPKDFKAWPDDGEIDIMEEVGYRPNYVSSAIHCKSYYHSIGTQKTAERFVSTAQSDFHIYALEWTETAINTYVDGVRLFTFANDGKGDKNTWPFNAAFYLKLNLAWGGDWGGAEGVDESKLPATYEIDYVRVFQKK